MHAYIYHLTERRRINFQYYWLTDVRDFFKFKNRISCECFNERPYTLNHMLKLTSLTFCLTLPNIDTQWTKSCFIKHKPRDPNVFEFGYVFVSIWPTLLIRWLFHSHWTGSCVECQYFRMFMLSSMPSLVKNGNLSNLSICTFNEQWKTKWDLISRIRTSVTPF